MATLEDRHAEMFEQLREQMRTKAGQKIKAQEMLMHGIANVLGYWVESEPLLTELLTDNEQEEFAGVLKAQADRVAKLLGYTEAWSN